MKVINKYTRILGLFCFLILSNCSTEKSLIGAWESPDKTEQIEFFKDNTFIIKTPKIALSGKYNFVDSKRVKFEFTGAAALAPPKVVKIEISGNELTIIDPNSDPAKYQRAN